MNNQTLKKLINQLRKYQITTIFNTPEELEEWLKTIKNKHITNIINLNIDPEEIKFPKELLINENLLNCDDYTKRINAMATLKNVDGHWHLFERLCSPNFLNSSHYYQDIALISKTSNANYPLWIINDDNFINSPYHIEDLKLIIESLNKGDLITESLVQVASNSASINSQHHQTDMQIIFNCPSDCLQPTSVSPRNGLNNLATNQNSLQDPYHQENMNLLLQCPITSEFLYPLMTNPVIINGNHYRDEINAIYEAKSQVTAMAMYYYIVNPQDSNSFDINSINFYDLDFNDESHVALYHCYHYLGRKNNQSSKSNPQYLKYLRLLNDIDDKFVAYFESLLSNKILFNSEYYEHDLNLLLEVTDPHIYRDLHQLMTNNISLNSPYHLKDAIIISQTENEKNRRFLLNKATNQESINSPNHEYDMIYISKLNLSKIKDNIYNCIYYYLFNPKGMNSKDHIEALEKLSKGEMYEPVNSVDEYLNSLENQLLTDDFDYQSDYQAVHTNNKGKILTRIKKLFSTKK